MNTQSHLNISSKKILLLILSLSLIFLNHSTAYTTTMSPQQSTLNRPGDILYVGGSGPGNYTSIQDAVDNATTGDMVFIYHGIYNESVWIETSITLRGENKYTTNIEGTWGKLIYVKAPNVTIQQLTVKNCGYYYSGGITLHSHSSNCTITETILTENIWCGLTIHGEKNNIYNNTISHNQGNGIEISADNTLIYHNILENNNGSGIVILWYDQSNNTQIVNNHITHNTGGVTIMNADNTLLLNNSFTNDGIACWALREDETTYRNHTTIINNTIQHGNSALYLIYTNHSLIQNNNIINTRYPINIETSHDNHIYLNNFIDYQHSAYDDGNNTWENNTINQGNYWSQYQGRDENHDNIGDTPHPISGGSNHDLYPLMHPHNYKLPSPSTVYINQTYDDTFFGWNYNRFNNIQQGIIHIIQNGTLIVHPGTYHEHTIINKSLTLNGANKTTTILNGDATNDGITIKADNVHIHNLTITNAGTTNTNAAIHSYNNHTTITHCIITNNPGYGILIDYTNNIASTSPTITHNIITHNHIGIKLIFSYNNTLSYNSITNNNHGIITTWGFLYNGCINTNISYNDIKHNQHGIRLETGSHTTIQYNNFLSNKRSASFYLETTTQWQYNYWGRPRLLPKLILGTSGFFIFRYPSLNLDWFPAKQPHTIHTPHQIILTIIDHNDEKNKIHWGVTELQGTPPALRDIGWALHNQTGINNTGATCIFHDFSKPGVINPPDQFEVTAPNDGYYTFLLIQKSTGSTIFKSSLEKY